jgi:hypothetical protein
LAKELGVNEALVRKISDKSLREMTEVICKNVLGQRGATKSLNVERQSIGLSVVRLKVHLILPGLRRFLNGSRFRMAFSRLTREFIEDPCRSADKSSDCP